MLRVLRVVGWGLICVGVPVALWEGMRITYRTATSIPPVTYVELITILLTGITVALAVLAVMVGLAAIWGFASIKTESASAARHASDAFMRKHIQSDAMKAMIKEAVEARESSAYGVGGAYASAFPAGDLADPGRVAEDYPGET